ncbi:MAG: T9SS type A sorting domain-containing protein [Chitinophagales bacterium]|nr:T9SS type A sorting domain-containing protein [Chitinophagales bacterium]
MKKLFLILIIPASLLNIAFAQSTINCMGGAAVLNGIIHEASIGEMSAVQTLSAGGVHITQGVLQKIEATPLSIENSGMLLEIDVFPNPTADLLSLQFNNSPYADIHIEIIDISGKKLIQRDEKIQSLNKVFSFDLSTYSDGVYLLNILANDGSARYSKISYQIVKR